MNVRRPTAQSKLGPTGKHPVASVTPIGLIWAQAGAVTYDYLGGTFGVVDWSLFQGVGGGGGGGLAARSLVVETGSREPANVTSGSGGRGLGDTRSIKSAPQAEPSRGEESSVCLGWRWVVKHFPGF